jgi:DNA-binding LacI/PurR family transcriptional regulator
MDRKLQIPGDIGIISFVDPTWTVICDPPLMAIWQHSSTMGMIAEQKLFTQIDNIRQIRDANLILRTEVVIRESYGETPE